MPELPDVSVYVEQLARKVSGETLRRVRLRSPFVLRSVSPPLGAAEGRRVEAVRRLGKRIVLSLDGDLHLVLHLMVAGRLKWKPGPGPVPVRGKLGLAAFDFDSGTLLFTEAGPKKRAWMRLVAGAEALGALDPGGLEVLEADLPSFRTALTMENHTLKRALTDPRLFSGIGNAYSDEILHRARLSPVALTRKLADDDVSRLFAAARETLAEWTDRLRMQAGDAFPERVTAFREEMSVHGKFGKPCPDCGSPVQRIVHADNETNYCPDCQTGGRLLADRSLSRLLRGDWPKSLEELEESKEERRVPAPPRKD
jgi:formamidopyrimidine-DNA glycosylase